MLPRPKRFELVKRSYLVQASKNVRDGVANPVPLGSLEMVFQAEPEPRKPSQQDGACCPV